MSSLNFIILKPDSTNLFIHFKFKVFEKDPIKYTEYQRAIQLALKDRISDEEAAGHTLVLMVLGAGRGPLVRASLKAAELSNRKVKVYAVEKNPNAGSYVTNNTGLQSSI